MKRSITKYNPVLIMVLLVLACSCRKFVEVPPPVNQIISATAFGDDKSAIATLNGIYSQMMGSPSSICASAVSLYPALSADELTYFTASAKDAFTQNQLDGNSDLSTPFWIPAYNFIYAANSCIEGAAQSQSLSVQTKNMVSGEAYFIRAFMYFNLVNLFGAVPKVVTTDYQVNKSLGRVPVTEIYALIQSDLIKSASLLQEQYPTDGRVRPNKATARALLAKVYLYQKNWQAAVTTADSVISDSRYRLPQDLNSVFLSTSQEAIWQLAPVTPNYNTYVGNLVVPASASAAPTYIVRPEMLNAFEAGDKRKSSWIQSRVYKAQTIYYPFKYKIKTGAVVTEYNMVFRLAELYLIRSEGKAELGDLAGAASDLNVIRKRAGLPENPTGTSQVDLLAIIQHERQTELCFEWGNRWFDLKRTSTANAVLGSLKPDTWASTDQLYPIPTAQILINPNLKQNEGYN